MIRKNSRAFQARRAAERYVDSYLQPSHRLNKADSRFRVILAFMQGADWERRRWKSWAWFVETPEQTLRSIRRATPPRMRFVDPPIIKVGMPITGNALPPGSRVASVFDDGHGGTP